MLEIEGVLVFFALHGVQTADASADDQDDALDD